MKILSIIAAFIVALTLSSCNSIERTDAPSNTEDIRKSIRYFRDGKLCYAAVRSKSYGGYWPTSITCVPCDSLITNQPAQSYDWSR